MVDTSAEGLHRVRTGSGAHGIPAAGEVALLQQEQIGAAGVEPADPCGGVQQAGGSPALDRVGLSRDDAETVDFMRCCGGCECHAQ